MFKIKTSFLLGLLCFLAVISWNCSDSNPQPEAVVPPPKDIVYSPQAIDVFRGESSKSAAPTFTGTKNFTFSLTVSPAAQGVTIATNGVINIPATLSLGNYTVNVTAQNKLGTEIYNNAFRFRVREPIPAGATAPSQLVYAPRIIEVVNGVGGKSLPPTIQGHQPMSYTAEVIPANSGITINPTTGEITVSAQVPVARYSVNVTATNVVNAVTFPLIAEVQVKPPTGAKATFEYDILPIMTTQCSGCHTDYVIYTRVRDNITNILDRIQRPITATGFMPRGATQSVPQAQIDLIKKWVADGRLER